MIDAVCATPQEGLNAFGVAVSTVSDRTMDVIAYLKEHYHMGLETVAQTVTKPGAADVVELTVRDVGVVRWACPGLLGAFLSELAPDTRKCGAARDGRRQRVVRYLIPTAPATWLCSFRSLCYESQTPTWLSFFKAYQGSRARGCVERDRSLSAVLSKLQSADALGALCRLRDPVSVSRPVCVCLCVDGFCCVHVAGDS